MAHDIIQRLRMFAQSATPKTERWVSVDEARQLVDFYERVRHITSTMSSDSTAFEQLHNAMAALRGVS